jgi:hypothetical protein
MIQSERLYVGLAGFDPDQMRLWSHTREEWNKLLAESRRILVRRSNSHRDYSNEDEITVEEARRQFPWMMRM